MKKIITTTTATKRILCIAAMIIVLLPTHAQNRRTVSILGDSYSTFRDYVVPDTNAVWYPSEKRNAKGEGNDVQLVRQTWWQLFLRQTGLRLCQNNSFSGATICKTGYRGEDYSNRSYVNRLRYLGSPDIIIVFGGTNDTWAKSPLGEFKYDNWTHQELYQFRPAMAYMLSELLDRYPNTDIYIVINDILSKDVTEAMTTICQHYGVKYILLHDIDKQWGHPSQRGMKQIADQLAEIIK